MKQARKTLSSDRTFGPGPSRETSWDVVRERKVRTSTEQSRFETLTGYGASAIEAARSVGLTLGETLDTTPHPVPEKLVAAAEGSLPEDRFEQLRGSHDPCLECGQLYVEDTPQGKYYGCACPQEPKMVHVGTIPNAQDWVADIEAELSEEERALLDAPLEHSGSLNGERSGKV